MKLHVALLALALFLVTCTTAQQRIILKYKGCSFSDDAIPSSINISNASDEALRYVRKICEVAVINNNFLVEEGDVPNALATTDDAHHRIIYYSKQFFGNLRSDTYKIAILAHEIGHHLNFDIFLSDHPRGRDDELYADKFAGSVLCRMGLKMEDAKQLLNIECPAVAKGFYPDREARIAAFQAGFDEVKGASASSDKNFASQIKQLLYKVGFNSSLQDILSFEWGVSHANDIDYYKLRQAIECTGEDIRYYWRYLKDSKLNVEIYPYLNNLGLKGEINDGSYIIYYFKDNKLARIGLRLFASDNFEQAFFSSLNQDMKHYPLRYQTEVNGLHFISGSSFTDIKSTEIFVMNEIGYNFCIHDWWHY
jgi:hypothetical protein